MPTATNDTYDASYMRMTSSNSFARRMPAGAMPSRIVFAAEHCPSSQELLHVAKSSFAELTYMWTSVTLWCDDMLEVEMGVPVTLNSDWMESVSSATVSLFAYMSWTMTIRWVPMCVFV